MQTIQLNGQDFEIPSTTDEWELDDPTGLTAPELTAALCTLLMEVARRVKEGYSVSHKGVMTIYERLMQPVMSRYVGEDKFEPRSIALYFIDIAVARLT